MLKIPGLTTYFGGKGSAGTYQRIINHIRPHDTLVIPFAGNCAITRAIQWPGRVLINDLDPTVLDAWRSANLSPQLEVYNLPALDFIRNVIQSPRIGRVVIYCDPPYPLNSRKSPELRYTHEMTDRDHEEFLAAVRFLRVDCLVGTYPNQRYAQQLSHWNRTEFQSQTRHGAATEWLFYNYPTPEILHDARFAGNDYREREYIKRKASRWLAKWGKMPYQERQVVLALLLAHTPQAMITTLTSNASTHERVKTPKALISQLIKMSEMVQPLKHE